MDLPGHQLLARSVLPQDENARVAGRGLLHEPLDGRHAGAGADHAVINEDAFLQGPVLLSQVLHGKGVSDHRHGPVQGERLLQEVEGPHLRGLDGKGDVGVSRDHDHLDVGVLLAHPLQDVHPAHVGEPHVEEHEINRVCGKLRETLDPVLRVDHGVPFVLEDVAEHRADAGLIIDDEDRAHAETPAVVGMSMKTVVPLEPSLSAHTFPLWSNTMRCTMARPSPVPSFFVVK